MRKLLKTKKLNENLTLSEIYEKRNKILIFRKQGGLGDVLMHRMIFEDFKKIDPNVHITFSCPSHLLDAVRDHPYVDDFIPSDRVNFSNYHVYDTSHACVRYETRKAPFSDKNRSDIWATHCGIELTSHNMHFNLSEKEKEYGKDIKFKITKNKPSILLCPTSSMPSKNLLEKQIDGILKGIKKMNLIPYVIHNHPIPQFNNLNIPVLYGQSIRQWLGIIDAADYVVSVDTAAFHAAGGLKKPLTGIFTWADGTIYGKYYDFILVQKHRKDGNWECGPCYKWTCCPLSKQSIKPCLTQITSEMILNGIQEMIQKNPLN